MREKMENMNVEIISRETVRPSSPTPHSLRNLELSFLDQMAPPIYIPIVLFYHSESSPGADHFQRSCLLKNSLAKCLTCFYPLAGRIKGQFSKIECNDEGVEYLEALVHCRLSQATEMADMMVLRRLLPLGTYCDESLCEREVVLAVQFNVFDCGGAAIGVCLSHKIADGTSMATFVNAWAAMSRASDDSNQTQHRHLFDTALHFPPRGTPAFTRRVHVTEDKLVTRRFVFSKSNIDALKEAVGSEAKDPTRVEAVSAFIWKRFLVMARAKQSGQAKACMAIHAVNLRQRMEPPLPDHTFGNFWTVAITPAIIGEAEAEIHVLVRQLRQSIRKIDGDFVKNLQSGDGNMKAVERASEEFSKGETEFINFTSWCRFGLYEVDFGWGKPTWVCSPMRHYKGLVILMSTRDGDGIEAWVSMLEEDMAMFGCDPELLSSVSSIIGD